MYTFEKPLKRHPWMLRVSVSLQGWDTLELHIQAGGKEWKVTADVFHPPKAKGPAYRFLNPPEDLLLFLFGRTERGTYGIIPPVGHDPKKVLEALRKEKAEKLVNTGYTVTFRQQVSDYDWPTIPLDKWEPDIETERFLEVLNISPRRFLEFAMEKGYATPVPRTYEGWSTVELTDYTVKVTPEVLQEFQSYKTPREREEEKKFREALAEARRTGKAVLLWSYSVPCDDPSEECDIDIFSVYVTPDGRKVTKRTHTW